MSTTTREGWVYRRCTRCGANLTGKTKDGEPRADVHAESDCESTEASWSFRVDVSPPGAPRRQRRGGGFATKAQALEAMAELQRTYRRGEAVEPSKMTVGQFLDGWLEVVRATRAAGTAENRKHHVAYIKRAGLGDVPLQALTELDVERMAARLAESGRARGGGLAPRSIADVNTTLTTALNEAVRKRLIPRNVAVGAYRASVHAKGGGEGVFAWSAEELAAWEAVAAEDELYPLWRFMAYTGCRKGEAIGLPERELDLSAGLVTFVRTRTKGAGGHVADGVPKSARSRRTIDLDPETVDVLREARRARTVVALGGASVLAFTLPDGSPIHPDAVRTRMRRITRAAGVPPLSPHGLRHTHATLMLLAGVPLHVVSRRLGHASESFTAQQYAHVLNGQGSAAASTFADLVGGKEAQ